MKKIFFVLVCLSLLAAVGFADPGDNLNWPDAPVTQEFYSYGYLDDPEPADVAGQFEIRLIPGEATTREEAEEIPNVWYISEFEVSEFTVELTYNPNHYKFWESLMSASNQFLWPNNMYPEDHNKSWFVGKLDQPTKAPHAWQGIQGTN